MKTFYSNGKLLLTSEYVVLDGAQALAIPTKYGQNLIVTETEIKKCIVWKSFDFDNTVWFEGEITFEEIFNKKSNSENTVKQTLINILHQANIQNPEVLKNINGFEVTTQLTFPRNWGLGTSSTLLNNIAKWFDINAFELLQKSFGGSGYDIACAQNNAPILYKLENQKPIVETVNFKPNFAENLYFVYLNQKQNSKQAIANYVNKQGNIAKKIEFFNTTTQQVIAASTWQEMALAFKKHEIELSQILEMQTIQESIFADFDGVIKSLGAWGGDFVLAISKNNPAEYFNKKGFETVISYKEMVL